MTTTTEIAERITKGVTLLDLKVPGWADKIDLGAFSFPEIDRCVIGQLFNGWFTGLDKLLPGRTELACEYGFDMTVDEYRSPQGGAMLREFHDAWVIIISDRQAA